jgi:NAD(P)-dependent dehydrogenase (short-subunit alcohol dehydrogenase family)
MDMLEMGSDSFDRLMNINLRGPFFLTQSVANFMLTQEGTLEDYHPALIFISSVSAVASSPERAEYCISKAGLSMASQVYADRLAGTGIRVYEIRPGVIYTDMTAGVKEKYDRKIAEGLIPENRWGQPEDIAKATGALAAGDIPYATGAVIEISGGMNIRHL